MACLCLAGEGSGRGVLRVVPVSGPITPAVATFVSQQLEQAAEAEDAAVLLKLDTPGGLAKAMRRIIQGQLNSSVPVAVWVAPAGARAASAGALISLAADRALMAPGTHIGAAHPVSLGAQKQAPDKTMTAKVVNDAAAYARSLAEEKGRPPELAAAMVRQSRSYTARQALEKGLVDQLAGDRSQVLAFLAEASYQRGEKRLTLPTSLAWQPQEMSARLKLLTVLANPNIAYLLLMLGFMGIFFEVSQPGVILPGAVGALALLLAFFGLQMLPVNWVGVLLLLLGGILLVLEVFVTSFGLLAIGALTALTFGSLMLFDSSVPALQVAPQVVFTTVAGIGLLALVVGMLLVRAQIRRPASGREALVGEIGRVETLLADGNCQVFVHGEYWSAQSQQPLRVGQQVRVEAVDKGLYLQVTPVTTNAQASSQERT